MRRRKTSSSFLVRYGRHPTRERQVESHCKKTRRPKRGKGFPRARKEGGKNAAEGIRLDNLDLGARFKPRRLKQGERRGKKREEEGKINVDGRN